MTAQTTQIFEGITLDYMFLVSVNLFIFTFWKLSIVQNLLDMLLAWLLEYLLNANFKLNIWLSNLKFDFMLGWLVTMDHTIHGFWLPSIHFWHLLQSNTVGNLNWIAKLVKYMCYCTKVGAQNDGNIHNSQLK